MQIIKEKLRFTGNDLNIKIPISGNLDQLGYQQEIDNFVLEETTGSINAVTDVEVKRVPHYFTTTPRVLNFGFYDEGDTAWYSYFTAAGFTAEEIIDRSNNYLNSFFILDFFDTNSEINQTKIFSSYLTNLTSTNTIPAYSVYNLIEENQFYDLNVPMDFFNASATTYTGYIRFSFYNAKTGRVSVFYNKDYEGSVGDQRMYFQTEINLINKTWQIITPSIGVDGTMYARELEFTTNAEYLERYNDTFADFENQQQNYPTGNVFIDDGTYTTI